MLNLATVERWIAEVQALLPEAQEREREAQRLLASKARLLELAARFTHKNCATCDETSQSIEEALVDTRGFALEAEKVIETFRAFMSFRSALLELQRLVK